MNVFGSFFHLSNPRVREAVNRLSILLHGKDGAIVRVLACLFSGGHLLLEDLPGLGKTTLVLATARLLGLRFGRVQGTNDLLPTDITGFSVYKQELGRFEFFPGPLFNNLLLMDEINRATPRTQSALLEAMGEEQATVDGVSHPLPKPFFVVATQNPVEHSGVFPLPESQMDRFLMKFSIGYPSREAEREILRAGERRREHLDFPALFSADEMLKIQRRIEREIHVSDPILNYVLDLAVRTRSHPLLSGGISPRGSMMLLRLGRTLAWMQNRDYLIPEDIRLMADEVWAHRIRTRPGVEISASEALRTIFDEVPVP